MFRGKTDVAMADYDKFVLSNDHLTRPQRLLIVNQEYQKISNMAVMKLSSGFIFKCLMDWCKFESPDERSFENHLRSHLNDGGVQEDSSFCNTCNLKIRAENISGEFQHMIRFHARKFENPPSPEVDAIKLEIEDDDDKIIEEMMSTVAPVGNDNFEGTAITDNNAITAKPMIEKKGETNSIDMIDLQLAQMFDSMSDNIVSEVATKEADSEVVAARTEKLSTDDVIVSLREETLENISASNQRIAMASVGEENKHPEDIFPVCTGFEAERHSKSSTNVVHKTRKTGTFRDKITASRDRSSIRHLSPDEACSYSSNRIEKKSLDRKSEYSSQNCAENSDDRYRAKSKRSATYETSSRKKSRIGNAENFLEDIPRSVRRNSSPAQAQFRTSQSQEKFDGIQTTPVSTDETCYEPHHPSAVPVNATELMPWAKRLHRQNCKVKHKYEAMKSKEALVSLYKCMDYDCLYTSDRFSGFLSHLQNHDRQYGRTNFHQLCSYCQFSNDNPVYLAKHIQMIHSFNKFQCSLCFYRSSALETVQEHLLVHHNQAHAVVLECPHARVRPYKSLLARTTDMSARNVHPVRCNSKSFLKQSESVSDRNSLF